MNKTYDLNSTTLSATLDEKFDLTQDVTLSLTVTAETVEPAKEMAVKVLVNDELSETVTVSSSATTPYSVTITGSDTNQSVKLEVDEWDEAFTSISVVATGESKPEPKPEPSEVFEDTTKTFVLTSQNNDCTIDGIVLSKGFTATATITGSDESYGVVVNTIINGNVTARNSITIGDEPVSLDTEYPDGTIVKAVGFGVDLFPSDVIKVTITVTGKVYKPSTNIPQGVSGVIMAEPGIAQFTVENGGTTGNKLDKIENAYPIIPDAVYQAPYDKVGEVELTYTDRKVPARIVKVSTSKGNIYSSNEHYTYNIVVRCNAKSGDNVTLTFITNQSANKLLLDNSSINGTDNKFTLIIVSNGYRQKFSHTLKSLSDENDVTTINIDFIPVQ